MFRNDFNHPAVQQLRSKSNGLPVGEPTEDCQLVDKDARLEWAPPGKEKRRVFLAKLSYLFFVEEIDWDSKERKNFAQLCPKYKEHLANKKVCINPKHLIKGKKATPSATSLPPAVPNVSPPIIEKLPSVDAPPSAGVPSRIVEAAVEKISAPNAQEAEKRSLPLADEEEEENIRKKRRAEPQPRYDGSDKPLPIHTGDVPYRFNDIKPGLIPNNTAFDILRRHFRGGTEKRPFPPRWKEMFMEIMHNEAVREAFESWANSVDEISDEQLSQYKRINLEYEKNTKPHRVKKPPPRRSPPPAARPPPIGMLEGRYPIYCEKTGIKHPPVTIQIGPSLDGSDWWVLSNYEMPREPRLDFRIEHPWHATDGKRRVIPFFQPVEKEDDDDAIYGPDWFVRQGKDVPYLHAEGYNMYYKVIGIDEKYLDAF